MKLKVFSFKNYVKYIKKQSSNILIYDTIIRTLYL